MVLTGWKKSGVFKATPKLGENPADLAPSARLPDTANSSSESSPASGGKSDIKEEKSSGFGLHHVHDGLSKVRNCNWGTTATPRATCYAVGTCPYIESF